MELYKLIWIAIAVLLFLAVVLPILVAIYVIRDNFVRPKKKEVVTPQGIWVDIFNRMQTDGEWLEKQALEKWEIQSSPRSSLFQAEKQLTLRAWYLGVPGSPLTVISHHGWKSNHTRRASFARYYHELGYSVLLPDLAAHGESDGTYIGMGNLDSKDLMLWIDELLRRKGTETDITLEGVSMGSATVLSCAGNPALPEQVKMVIADCGFTSGEDELNFHMPEFLQGSWIARYVLLWVHWVMKALAGYRLDDNTPLDNVRRMHIPALIIHGKKDDFVPYWMGEKLFENCASQEKVFLAVEEGFHASSFYQDEVLYKSHLRQFIEKNL